jgi:hypothetical protein
VCFAVTVTWQGVAVCRQILLTSDPRGSDIASAQHKYVYSHYNSTATCTCTTILSQPLSYAFCPQTLGYTSPRF